MSKVITLSSGQTVTLRDPKTLLMKDRNKVLEIANKQEGIMQSVALQNGVLAVMIQEWSLDLIPPSIKVDSLDMLSPADYEKILAEAIEAQEYLFPTLAETPEGIADPKVITANSNA